MVNINPWTLIFQIVNFFVMVVILTRFFFRPVVRTLDERSRKVTSTLEEAAQREQAAQEAQAQYEQKLAEAEEQALAIKQRAQEELEETRRRVLEETRSEIRTTRTKAQRELEEARQQAIEQHQRELAQLVTALSERLMREAGGESFQQASLQHFLEQLAELPPDAYRHVLEQDESEVVRAEITSAHELDNGVQSMIEEQVRRMANRPVDIRYRVDPALVAGATMRFGDVVIDGSVAGQLQDLRERYTRELESGKT